MRLLIDTLVAVMTASVLAGIVWTYRAETAQERAVEECRQSVELLTQQVVLQGALRQVPVSTAGYPLTVDPEWFKIELPENTLCGPGHPWLEVAGVEERNLEHPQVRAVTDKDTATFWYNPYQGVVRARVPYDSSDQAAVGLYNSVNGTRLDSLFE